MTNAVSRSHPLASAVPGALPLALWLLTAAFAARVAGQAIQRLSPQAFLPPFEAFQGSRLPYWALLSTQLAILGAMVLFTFRIQAGTLVATRRAGRLLRRLGIAYLSVSIGRIVIGLAVPGAPAWFTTWIPAFFHLVLASWVLLVSGYHDASAVVGRTRTSRMPRPASGGGNARSGASGATAAMRDGVLPALWYPLIFGAAIALHVALLAQGLPLLAAAYTPVALAAVGIVILERLDPARLDWRPHWSDVRADAGFLLAVQVVLPRLLALGLALAVADRIHESGPGGPWPHTWPIAVQVILMVLVVDFMRYWLHRACHTWLPLWRLHEVHHSPDLLYTLNVGRFHPLEKVLQFCLDTVPFVLLGVAPEVIAGYFLAYSVNGFFQHSNLRLRYGWLNHVVGSAETHRWHHARDPKTGYCNFGNTTILWDHLFGTWYLPRARALDIGIPDRAYPKGFGAQMLAPFRAGPGPARSLRQRLTDQVIAAQLRIGQWRLGRQIAAAAHDPMRIQRALLQRLLHDNRDTAFGRAHGFAAIRGYADFVANVPVHEYEALRPHVEAAIARGERALTVEPPVRYVRTSGTTGQPKDIPLTAAHLAQLRAIHRASVASQYRISPAAFAGSILAITSPAAEGTVADGTPFGSASGVLAGSTPALLQDKFAVPPIVFTIADSRVKYLLLLRLAITRRDLSYLGTANPTTLLALIRLYREHESALLADVRAGGFFLAPEVPPDVMAAIGDRLKADPARAAELAALINGAGPRRIRDLWPQLALVVTWTCASAGVAVAALRTELAAHTHVHELGYVSSEFRGTITIGRRAGSGMPTLDTHFFEFVERSRWDSGDPEYLTLDRLRKGVDYYVIVTTPSGLYRYFINDIVRVTGFLHRLPLLQFRQKGKGVTSITGEKLYESQVLAAIGQALAAAGSAPRFLMMLADEQAQRYRLYVEPDAAPGLSARQLGEQVDARLQAINIEYAAKRESGRLGDIEAHWLAPGTEDAWRRDAVARGQREGQLKIIALAYRSATAFDLDAHRLPP